MGFADKLKQGKLHEDNKKNQASISVLKKEVADIQKYINALNVKLDKNNVEVRATNKQLKEKDYEKDLKLKNDILSELEEIDK